MTPREVGDRRVRLRQQFLGVFHVGTVDFLCEGWIREPAFQQALGRSGMVVHVIDQGHDTRGNRAPRE